MNQEFLRQRTPRDFTKGLELRLTALEELQVIHTS